MSIDVLVQGKLVKAPEQRTASNGKPYSLAQAAVAMDEGDVLAGVVTFESAAVAGLLALGKGDAVAVAGRAKVGVWQPREGEPRASLSITAEQVLTAYHLRRKRQAVQSDDDGRTPAPGADRRVAGRDSSRSGTSARAATTPGGIHDLADDDPFVAEQ
jgi:single-stranded DNA-binding protein